MAFYIVQIFHNEAGFCDTTNSQTCQDVQALADNGENIVVWEYANALGDPSQLGEYGLTTSQLPYTQIYDMGTEAAYNDALQNGEISPALIVHQSPGVVNPANLQSILDSISTGGSGGDGKAPFGNGKMPFGTGSKKAFPVLSGLALLYIGYKLSK